MSNSQSHYCCLLWGVVCLCNFEGKNVKDLFQVKRCETIEISFNSILWESLSDFVFLLTRMNINVMI